MSERRPIPFSPFTRGQKRQPAAATFRLPLGPVVADCRRCGRPVHESERTYVYEAHGWHDVHRSCRNDQRSKGGR